jgi:NADH:ubiquinone oxidoreductase subunit 6 (subunit J)
VAHDLFGNKVLAFELTSVLLVIAVVATVLLTRRAKGVDAPADGAVSG